MASENAVKGTTRSRINGFMAQCLGLGGDDTEAGFWGTVRGVILSITMTIAAVVFIFEMGLDISIKLQESRAISFDSQGALAANHLSPKQAADKVNAGQIVYDKDGAPIAGKSLVVFMEYLAAQAKSQAAIQESNAAAFDPQSELAASHLTPKQAIDKLNAGQIINGRDGAPIAGKSLIAFVQYLAEQAKSQTVITEAGAKSAPMKW